jgi:hypothetical protein
MHRGVAVGYREKILVCKSRREASVGIKLPTPYSWTSGF